MYTLEEFIEELEFPVSSYPHESVVNGIDVIQLDRVHFAVMNNRKQIWEVVDNQTALISLIVGHIHPKDDLIKEAMAAIHSDDKQKALSLLSDALRL